MAIFMIGGGWTDIKVISISHPSRMPQLIQDITQNFTERINRLEMLCGVSDNPDEYSVVTFDQTLHLLPGRLTYLAEGFDPITHYIILSRTGVDPSVQGVTVKGYLSRNMVLILLEAPEGLSGITEHQEDHRLCVRFNGQDNIDRHQPLKVTMYRIEGNCSDLLYDNTEREALLCEGWEEKLKTALRRQIDS